MVLGSTHNSCTILVWGTWNRLERDIGNDLRPYSRVNSMHIALHSGGEPVIIAVDCWASLYIPAELLY